MFGTIKKHLNGKMPFSNILRFNKLNSSIPEPPWEYDFLLNLPQIEYPKYLAKAYKYRTNEDLPLSFDIKNGSFVIDKAKCKTYNQKMQWLKLYDATPLKKLCTDKVTARNYVQEKIGAQYLKPVLQICNSFDEINFDTLPDCFIMKCSHGCKWQFSIRNKNDFLSSKRTFFDVKQQMKGWLEQEYWCWGGFELTYKDISPKIIIEEYLGFNEKTPLQEIEVYCFSSVPKLIKKVHNDVPNKLTMYDENFNCINFKFLDKEFLTVASADETIKKATELSKILSKDFKFVRVDWINIKDKLYFNELTFSPNSGFINFDPVWNEKLGDFIKI